jgi:ABC-type polar amino acid transport system ATPase subunit
VAQKVKVRNLYKSFGSLSVLEGLDLDVEEGEVVCMIGPSGSGKSTFLRCLNRLEEATSGKLRSTDSESLKRKSTSTRFAKTSVWCFSSLTSSLTSP